MPGRNRIPESGQYRRLVSAREPLLRSSPRVPPVTKVVPCPEPRRFDRSANPILPSDLEHPCSNALLSASHLYRGRASLIQDNLGSQGCVSGNSFSSPGSRQSGVIPKGVRRMGGSTVGAWGAVARCHLACRRTISRTSIDFSFFSNSACLRTSAMRARSERRCRS